MLGFQFSDAESGPEPWKLNKMSCHCHEPSVCCLPTVALSVWLMNLPRFPRSLSAPLSYEEFDLICGTQCLELNFYLVFAIICLHCCSWFV